MGATQARSRNAAEGDAIGEFGTAEGGPPAEVRNAPGRWARVLFRGLGFLCLALAIAGVVLPGLPATPFALLAVWAFGRGSPEWAARIERDPRFGPTLRHWREHRAVPRKAKILAVLSMAASYALLLLSNAPLVVLIGIALVLLSVATYLITRPSI